MGDPYRAVRQFERKVGYGSTDQHKEPRHNVANLPKGELIATEVYDATTHELLRIERPSRLEDKTNT